MRPCPVCGFDKLTQPPEDHYICPCCGTEFGYEDYAATFDGRFQRWQELRQRWINAGMPWFSRATPPPVRWEPARQLLTVADVRMATSSVSEKMTQEFAASA